ncbi:nucleolar GTP-binding protein 1 isoform X2 [Arachis duranensis]|uniref:Nucleolar GTP-binding protein 1 isoform X2 n=1 Tax=Arachis duranensis TaxID=130453 RepID=A0A9C6WJS9_ARADU|nr:nucleolar GTP-binding protein 1 isoform X2 [Arachis duranensis]
MKSPSSLFLRGHIPCANSLLTTYKGAPNATKHPIFYFCKSMQTNSYEIANGSYNPTVQQTKEKSMMEKQSKKIESIGAFQKLPIVMPSIDILGSALRKAKKISPTKGIANIAKREKNKGAKQLDALMKELAVPLRTYVESFPDKAYLHPYERSLIELTLGDGYYEKVLGKVDTLRKRVVSVGKEHASLCAKSSSKREAEERLNGGLKKIEEIFASERKVVDDLLGIAKTLRAMPVINLETPTLCLVGAPNVGKSSLVHVLSTGKPEICNYPFTTRVILMGHIVLNYQKFQVTDTPGLLKRQDAVLYVHDLSGECGTSPSDQFSIYKEIKERFSGHLWLDVVSKFDLLKSSPVVYATEKPSLTEFELEKYRKSGPDGAIHVSVKTQQGLNELKKKVHELLSLQMVKIKDTMEQPTEVKGTTQSVTPNL